MPQLLLLFIIAVVSAISALRLPHGPSRRQLGAFPDGLITGNLGALEGAFGVTAAYDYVVVGGGTAGVAMGVRLAESGADVAIIEAGGYYEIGETEFANTPGGDVLFVGSDPADSDPLVDWGFVARNQPGANYRPVHYARGKCIGGRYDFPVPEAIY